MSEENVATVVGVFEAVNARDFPAVMNAYADDITLAIHADVGVIEVSASGKQAVGDWFGDWFRQFADDYKFEIEEARGSGDRVFLVATHLGTGRVSGVRVTQRTAYVYKLHDSKIQTIEVWVDREAALAESGFPEQGDGAGE